MPNKSQMTQAEQPAANGTGGEICDLCGTAVAIVKCAACSEQIFCLACDDMYHRHPKRTTHARKALSNSQPIRPPLPPKGDAVATPVAPPRKNLRKGSAPDSPVTQHQTHLATRSSTLPRKAGSMVGRPLPPPPPVVEANPPPALPAKNINPPPPVPPPQLPHQQQQTSFYPNDNNGLMQQRKMSIHSQAPPMHFQQQPDIPLPAGYPMAAGSSFTLDNRHHRIMQPPANPMAYPNAFNYPVTGGSGTANGRYNPMDGTNHQVGWGSKVGNPYLEEMQFPAPGVNKTVVGSSGSKTGKRVLNPVHKRNQFVRLNKSSSLHDIAHEEMNMRPTTEAAAVNIAGNGISWMDEPWNTTQSTMNQPTLNMQELLEQQRNFRRASSTKSLHQTNEDLWNSNPNAASSPTNPWGSTNPMLNPMLNPMMFINAAGQPAMPNALHRSMHELRGMGGAPSSIRAQSPATSQKSKKSTRSEKFHHHHGNHHHHHRASGTANSIKHHHNNQGPASSKKHDKPQSRPHSRNNSQRRHYRKESSSKMMQQSQHHHRSTRESSRSRASSRRRSISSEDDEDDIDDLGHGHMDSDVEAVINDMSIHGLDEDEDSEDFFTGESDNDFVSISSGGNSKRVAVPRKSWTCEHCTYVNNPGVAVCTVCCRTSKQSRGEEFEVRSASRSSGGNRLLKKKVGNHHRKYDTSEEDNDSSLRGSRSVSRQGLHENKTRSSQKSRNGNKKHAKSPMPEFNVSDLDEDAINDYYAVRHQNNNSHNERYIESSSETGSSMNNNPAVPTRKPNFDAPAPAKGILKKSNSNPQLTKLELDSKFGKSGERPAPIGKVVDIKKYLAQTQNNPHLNESNDNDNEWQQQQQQQRRGQKPSNQQSQSIEDYLSDGMESNSSVTNNIGRANGTSQMTRSVSGHSLGDLEYIQQQYDQQQGGQHNSGKFHSRRTSDATGKKNFRSKRFSRNLEREPAIRRAQSLHMDHRRGFEDNDPAFMETHRGVLQRKSSSSMRGKPSSSGSSGPEDALHFTATVEGQEVTTTGSYLARQEFGGHASSQDPNGLAAVGDSGYISHSSGGGGGGSNTAYHQNSTLERGQAGGPIESFTMSVDRGYLGRAPGGVGGEREPYMHRSMDDLTFQKTKGLELVRLLRVSMF